MDAGPWASGSNKTTNSWGRHPWKGKGDGGAVLNKQALDSKIYEDYMSQGGVPIRVLLWLGAAMVIQCQELPANSPQNQRWLNAEDRRSTTGVVKLGRTPHGSAVDERCQSAVWLADCNAPHHLGICVWCCWFWRWAGLAKRGHDAQVSGPPSPQTIVGMCMRTCRCTGNCMHKCMWMQMRMWTRMWWASMCACIWMCSAYACAGGGGGEEKNSWYRRTAFFSGGTPRGGGGTEKNSRENFFQAPKTEISSTLPHLFGFGRCKEDIFQGNH